MAEIDDTLPNVKVSDEAFVEQEVAIPGIDESSDKETGETKDVEITMDEEGGAEINFDPNAAEALESDDHFSNLAEIMDEQYLPELGTTLFDQYTDY